MLVDIEKFRRILSLELREKSKENVFKVIKVLEKREDILSAEPNSALSITQVPNDSMYTEQWGLTKINAPAAWNISIGVNLVIVGVLDTGIDGDHKDLKNRIHKNTPQTIDNTLHRDFISNEEGDSILNPTDPNGHGTHVAGIIRAQGNNSIGIAGVCGNVKLVSIRVFNSEGGGDSKSLAKAIDYAASKKIPILNFSGGVFIDYSSVKRAIESYEGLLVCAAGNYSLNTDIFGCYPSSYSFDNIISVSSSDMDDKRSI